MFVYLNNKSGYSFLESSLKINELVKYGIDNKMSSLALTDHNNMFGTMEFISLCKENNIKPIIGMEINLAPFATPLVVIASSNEGYVSLCKLTTIVSRSSLNETISLEQLNKYKDGLICILPYIRSHLIDKTQEEQINFIQEIKNVFKAFYIGLEWYKNEDITQLYQARKLATSTMSLTVPIVEVLTNDATSVETLNVLKAIDLKTSVDNLTDFNFMNHHFLSEGKIKSIFTEEEIYSTYTLSNLCNIDLSSFKGSLYEYKVSGDYTQFEYLKGLCQKGLEKRIHNITNEYSSRLSYELNIINKMGYVNYFLVVYDYVKFAKQNNILVGPARGSAGGSLAAYALGITNVDPVKYDLLFERFLNPERVSMPDIDVDFIDSRRDEIFNYITNKYGKDKTARVVTFQTFKARSSLRDVSKALGCSVTESDNLTGKLAKIKSEDLKELVENSPTILSLINTNDFYKKIYDISLKIEGLPRQSGIHAAGIVINNDSLCNIIPVYQAFDDAPVVTQCDLKYLEDFNLLKMDILGLTNLSAIDDCKRLIKHYHNIDIDLNNIDLNDPNIYKIMNSGKLSGIFQMDQAGMGRAVSVIKPECFEDVVAVLALGRPGPMQFLQTYKDRKDGKEKVTYLHPSLEPVLKSTYGIIVYQEQVMQILCKMAGFTLGKADLVRRAISKKQSDELASVKDEFIKGCIKNGYGQKEASSTFENILNFANYGFNRSHSVAYSIIACQMAYLKYYYPKEFYTSILNIFGEEDKIANYFYEIKSNNIKMSSPSINKSTDEFAFDGENIVFAFTKIKEITPSITKIILEERQKAPFKDFVDFVVRTHVRGLNSKTITALIDAGCFDEFNINRKTLKENLNNIIMYSEIVSSEKDGLISFDFDSSSKPLINYYDEDLIERLENEKNRLGLYLSGFPLEKDREIIKNADFVTVNELNQLNKTYKLVLFINKVKPIRTKKGTNMAILDCVDETGNITVTVFPEQYAQFENILRKDNYIQVKGKLEKREDKLQLLASLIKIYKLQEAK